MDSYLEALDNPFTKEPIKLHDGLVGESSAVKIKTSGTFVSQFTNPHAFIIPCMSNSVVFYQSNGYPPDGISALTVPQDHVNTGNTALNNTLYHRLVSTGVRFKLVNEGIKNDDGIWEAVRIPVTGTSGLDFAIESGQWRPNGTRLMDYMTKNIGSSVTYQSGMLRDLHKYVFKLNHENNQRPMDINVIKQGFDMIYLRFSFKKNDYAGSLGEQSRLYWWSVSNQEIVYNEGTALSKYHTPCYSLANINDLIQKTRRVLPGTYAPDLEI